ncbi:hypothetical protein FD755_019856, partial [Muntiacus reevesi]
IKIKIKKLPELLAKLDFHSCEKAMPAKGGDSLYPISWLSAWDDRQAEGIFPGKI